MTTARYPKDVLLERVDAKIAGLADEQAQEEQQQLSEAQQFVDKAHRASVQLDEALQQLYRDTDELRETLHDEDVPFADRFNAARSTAEKVSRFGSDFPQPSWRLGEYRRELTKIAKRYEVKRRFLEGKRSIIEAADAPDGFTMTALEKLHLLEAIG